ncbi:MAG: hypothetical protein AAF645_04560 [Myxococcota bacterium]
MMIRSIGLLLTTAVAACAGGAPPPAAALRTPLRVAEGPPPVDPSLWSRYLDALALCDGLSHALAERAAEARRRSIRNGRLSSVAGVLAMASGIVAGTVASSSDSGTAERVGAASGAAGFAFGITATTSGILASRRGAATGQANALAQQLESAAYDASIRIFQHADRASREQAVLRTLPSLVGECVGTASVILDAAEVRDAPYARPGARTLAEGRRPSGR